MVDLPFGGGKGGMNCDPSKLSRGELERLTRKFVQQIHDFIGPDKDIPAPDVGTDAQVMAWIMNEYSKYHGFHPACVTGKPVEFHGSAGREAATGYGVAIMAREVLTRLKKTIAGTTFAIQGYGNVGSNTARFLHQQGGKILAVSDAYGAVVNPEGIDIPALDKHVAVNRKVVGFKGGDASTNEQLLTMPVDVLIPAALGGVFDATMARAVQAKVIIEAANGPTWPEADEVFQRPGHPRRPRHPGQCRRRHRQLLRVGPEPPALPLVARAGPARGGEPARRELRQDLRPGPAEGPLDADRRLHAGHHPGRPRTRPGGDLTRPRPPRKQRPSSAPAAPSTHPRDATSNIGHE